MRLIKLDVKTGRSERENVEADDNPIMGESLIEEVARRRPPSESAPGRAKPGWKPKHLLRPSSARFSLV